MKRGFLMVQKEAGSYSQRIKDKEELKKVLKTLKKGTVVYGNAIVLKWLKELD